MPTVMERQIPAMGAVKLRAPGFLVMMSEPHERALQAEKGEEGTVFSNLVLSHMFLEPPQTPEDVGRLSDDALEVLVKIAAESAGIDRELDRLPADLTLRERLYQAYSAVFGKFIKELELWRDVYEPQASRLAEDATRYKEHVRESLLSSIPPDTLSNLNLSLERMADLNLRNTAADMMRFQPAFLEIVDCVTEPLRGMAPVLARQPIEEISRLLTQPGLRDYVEQVARIGLPEPFLSDSLYVSGLNSPLIHSRTYVLPEAVAPTSECELEVRATGAERRRLVDAYDILIQLEQTLRELIENKLRHVHGAPWWRRGIPHGVRNDCEQRKKEKEGRGQEVHHPILYAYIDDYRSIIAEGQNWRDLFSPVFRNRTELEASFIWVSRARPAIAHVRPIADHDYVMFVAGAHWIQTAIRRTEGLE